MRFPTWANSKWIIHSYKVPQVEQVGCLDQTVRTRLDVPNSAKVSIRIGFQFTMHILVKFKKSDIETSFLPFRFLNN